MHTITIDALQSPQGKTNTVLMNSLLVKLSQYKQREVRLVQMGWDKSATPEQTFRLIDVRVKIQLIERLLARPEFPISLDDYFAEVRADEHRRAWLEVIWNNRLPIVNAFNVIAQYVRGERTALLASTPPSTFN